ncbi:MAG: membrane protein insertion efficiency factor YidD [Proteobacteria bacterium]|jgi:hypothetical protein|nr:membrane protein insertion efficiency factor YidD [Pseudomonadota bacterium]
MSYCLIKLIQLYQMTLHYIIGRHCRFTPTCSHYTIQAIQKYGAIKGSWKGVCRICRCRPGHGGYDPP